MINVGRRAEEGGARGGPAATVRRGCGGRRAESGGRGPSPPSPTPPARVCAQDARQAAQAPAVEQDCQKPERCVPTASAGCRMRMIQRAPWHDDSDPPECGQWRQRAAGARASRTRQARRRCQQAGDAEDSPQPESCRQQRCRTLCWKTQRRYHPRGRSTPILALPRHPPPLDRAACGRPAGPTAPPIRAAGNANGSAALFKGVRAQA